ncbi:MAG: aminotransferase class III-fold pyridoxal phosphate-dependent enzyme [Gemmatimonadaceae bacterium]|nr:aminotransferase class III-fold pyridoxal phosphate-dependent enzyme [Gemmatimonadaceae bacterium]
MALTRFFRGRDSPPPPLANVEPDDTTDVVGEDAPDDAEPEVDTDIERGWRHRAEALLPTGASTGSKRADALYGRGGDGPTHFVSARGAYLVTVDGARLLDCTMALGAVSLGYAEPRVTRAVVDAASEGNVSALSSWREVELAERLCAMIPCAERAQLLKTGAEATTAAVRLARAYTGRTGVIACGYFGWHDWSSSSPGVPAVVQGEVTTVAFDDITALEAAVAASSASLAAIVIEPVVERAPSIEWLRRARELCDASGAALIFDEVKTGLRVAPGGYQELSGVTPDLASFGKALANGYPLAAVVGRAPLMEQARQSWISSTLASESTALAAALAVLDWHDEADICATLGETGREMRDAVDRAITASGTPGVHTEGIDAMWLLRWNDAAAERRFLHEAVQAGVLFKRGAYNFAAVAHDEEALRAIEAAASAAFVAMREET